MRWSEISRSVMSNSLGPHGLHSPWNSPSQNTGVGTLSLLQGIFPFQGFNPGLPHCRQILYQLSHKGSPRILEWIAYPFYSPWNSPGQNTGVGSLSLLWGIFPTQELNQDLLHCRRILSQLSYERSPSQVNTLLNILPPLLKLVDVGIGCSLELILVLITW